MFFKKKEMENNNYLTKVCALLIHAAKIDENYTEIEEKLIKKTLIELGLEKDKTTKIINDAKKIEENSNQILDFTREVKKIVAESEHLESNSNQILDFTREIKNKDNKFKIEIIETLWNIIYSNNEADIYESNLMRRLSGLLYIDNKVMGDIKDKIKKKFD